MKERFMDLTNPEEAHKELFHDNAEIVAQFAKYFSEEILNFSISFSKASKKWKKLDNQCKENGDDQSVFVSGITHQILETLFTSYKLQIFGLMTPSGNLFRQAIESVALATLCTLKENIQIPYMKKNKAKIKHIHFFSKFIKRHSVANSSKAMFYLEENSERIGINENALTALKESRKFYHNYSHPSFATLATNISFEIKGRSYIGGCFDAGKMEIYIDELNRRNNFCKVLPNVIDALIYKTKELAADFGNVQAEDFHDN